MFEANKAVKWLHVCLENSEYEALLKRKGNRTWREFILELLKETSQAK